MDIYVPECTINTWNINRYTYSFQAVKNATMRTDGVTDILNFNGYFKGYGDKVGIIYIGRGKPYFGRVFKSSRS